MQIVVFGVPHTITDPEFSHCAFTMKAYHLCKMMKDRGHEVIHVGVEGSTAPCSELIEAVPKKIFEQHYGHPGERFFNLETEGPFKQYHDLWAKTANKALKKKLKQPWTAILGMTWGGTQRRAIEGLHQYEVETGIGYRHTWAPYRVFESYAWLHMQLGAAAKFDGNAWYDAVIPNAFDPDMFGPVLPMSGRDGYYVYLGRLNDDKGVHLAVDIAKRMGKTLKICGQGDPSRFLKGNPHVQYIPPVGVEGRRELLRKAELCICATYYVEPFCGVNVEAQLSGTPVLSTDWGVFNETVQHGYTGYRCRTIEQFLYAAKQAPKLDPFRIRAWAKTNYSLERVALMYEEYFQMVLNQRDPRKWYVEHPERNTLEWLQRTYPGMDSVPDLKRHHVAPKLTSEWDQAQTWEREWWGLSPNEKWEEERKKQDGYFRMMGAPNTLDFADKTILDVGCGPMSVLLRSKHGPAVGVDPLLMSKETRLKYAHAGVELLNMKAEDGLVQLADAGRIFDEVWCYNCLQHVEDVDVILEKMAEMGSEIRLFEWIDLGICPGHIQVLTEKQFDTAFPHDKWERKVWNVGWLRGFGGTVEDKYIALHLVKKAP